jgi:hypothetical protein
MSAVRTYKIIFYHQGQVVELYARQVSQGNLFGFIEIEDLVFGTRSQLVVDPAEESLKSEFGGAKRIYLPMQAIVRIDEVEIEGVARIRPAVKDPETPGSVRPFPVPVFPPGRGPGEA